MTLRACYLSGTQIRSARGEVDVDSIREGDEVTVRRDGQDVLEPVRWVGYSSVDLARHAHVEDAAPIRIRANAIAQKQPVRDLLVSPEHCLVMDGYCVPAKLLVNGGSIVSERDHAPFTYYHIELDRHGILLAENTPAESYLDTGNRSLFDNGPDPRQLHPRFRLNANAAAWATEACAPLAQSIDAIQAIWRRLADRSVAIGYPVAEPRLVEDAGICLVADGRIIEPTADRNGCFVFVVPEEIKTVVCISRFCIPSDKMIASQRDTRRLGVRVNWIAICSNHIETVIAADHPALADGWHDIERDATSLWRWTDGAAAIPWNGVTDGAVVTISCLPVDGYPLYDENVRLVA